jgi:hypothetical protein
MAEVTAIAKPNLTGKRLAFALAEDRIGHYAEFRAYFVRIFDLDRIGLAEPSFVQTSSGLTFALVFIRRSGEPFPSGVEVYAVVDALEPIDDSVLDSGIWAILCWMIEGVGAPWTRHDLEVTGGYIGFRRLWRAPVGRCLLVVVTLRVRVRHPRRDPAAVESLPSRPPTSFRCAVLNNEDDEYL